MAATKKTAEKEAAPKGLQTGVDVRRFTAKRGSLRAGAVKWTIDLYNADDYVMHVGGEDYIFVQVLASKAKASGSVGALNAIYRLSAAPNASVLLYGVKAIAVSSVNASGYVELNLHVEQGTDTFKGE